MIIRVEHKQRYTVIADASLRDGRLSFRATGVLAYLMSLPDGTDISGRRLCAAKLEGRDAVLKALKELEDAGYLVRTTHQDEAGLWATTCTLHEVGSPSPENPDSVTENPPAGVSVFQAPSPEKPNSDNQASKDLVPEVNTKSFKAAGSQEPDDFDAPDPNEDGHGPTLQAIVRRLAAKSRA